MIAKNGISSMKTPFTKIAALVAAFAVLMLLAALVQATDYNIATCADLQNMQNDPAGNYTLLNNIDCSNTKTWNSGDGFLPIENFTGELRGGGFVVDKLFINRPTENTIGLIKSCPGFSTCASVITEIGLTNINYTCGTYCGGFAGYNGGIINKTYTTGDIVGAYSAYAGGLVGVNIGVIDNSWAETNISAYQIKGGLLGYNGGVINNCYSLGWCGSDGGYGDRGGLCGMQVAGTVTGGLYWNKDLFTSVYYAVCAAQPSPLEYAKNTTELQKKSTYSGWDFTNTWQICTRQDPTSYPSLRAFGLCCVGVWSCNSYSICANNTKRCLNAQDSNCGYTYDAALDPALSDYNQVCYVNAIGENIGLSGFDLRYEANIYIFGILILLWLGLAFLSFTYRNFVFGSMMFIIGVILGFMVISISVILSILFLLLSTIGFAKYASGFH